MADSYRTDPNTFTNAFFGGLTAGQNLAETINMVKEREAKRLAQAQIAEVMKESAEDSTRVEVLGANLKDLVTRQAAGENIDQVELNTATLRLTNTQIDRSEKMADQAKRLWALGHPDAINLANQLMDGSMSLMNQLSQQMAQQQDVALRREDLGLRRETGEAEIAQGAERLKLEGRRVAVDEKRLSSENKFEGMRALAQASEVVAGLRAQGVGDDEIQEQLTAAGIDLELGELEGASELIDEDRKKRFDENKAMLERPGLSPGRKRELEADQKRLAKEDEDTFFERRRRDDQSTKENLIEDLHSAGEYMRGGDKGSIRQFLRMLGKGASKIRG